MAFSAPQTAEGLERHSHLQRLKPVSRDHL